MHDLRTMIWKEWRDFLWSGGRADLLRPLLNIAVLGIILPLSFRQGWLQLEAGPVLIVVFTPFMFVILIISDAIAGERERHTLETLLASRISDRAILLGKVVVTVGYNWLMTLFCLLLGAVVVNVSLRPGQWEFYNPISLAFVLVLCFLTTLCAAGGGVLVSLKSVTVRQASQIMLLGLIILGLAITTVVKLVPPELTASLSTLQMGLIIMLGLVVLDTILLVASLLSFQRSRLILS